MTTDVSTSLVGRSVLLAELRSALEQSDGRDRCVLLVGEPGIGKSAVLAAVRELARDAGALVLTVRGVEAERQLPFAGLQQLLSPLTGQVGGLPPAQREAVEAALGLAAAAPPESFLVGLGSLGLVSDAAKQRDLVILVDDLCWVDPPSQAVLAFLARRLADQPVVLVAAARSGYDRALAGLGQVFELEPLTADACERLVLRSDPTIDARTLEYVLSQARGNPLALVELTKAMPRGYRSPGAGMPPTIPLPRSLTRAFGARLPSLPPATRDAVLVAAAYVGAEVAPVLTAASAMYGAPVTVADLEPAVVAGLLDVTGQQLHFRHPLVRSVVITGETASRRLAAHAALGAVLSPGSLARAWHRASATITEDDQVADELEAVAPLALSGGSVASAVRCLERSAELTSHPGRRGRRYLAAAVQGLSIGDADSTDEQVTRGGRAAPDQARPPDLGLGPGGCARG